MPTVAEWREARTRGLLNETQLAEFAEAEKRGIVEPEQQAPAAQAEAGQEVPSRAAGSAQAALQGATFGLGQDIQAGIGAGLAQSGQGAVERLRGLTGRNPPPVPVEAPTFGQQFTEGRDALRQDAEAFADENPLTALGATVAGGLATGGTAVRALRAAGAPVTGIKGALGTGGVLGAVAGAGTAEEGERLEGAAGGAVFGALAGAAVSGVAGVAGSIFRKLAPGVRNRLNTIAEQSGLTPTQIHSRLVALGPKATLADVDAVFRDAADVAAIRLGPVKSKIAELIRRDEGQFGRLREGIKRTLGGVDDSVQTLSQLKEVRRQVASPLYEKAFDAGIQPTAGLQRAFETPAVKAAWNAIRREGLSDPAVDERIIDAASRAGANAQPSFRGWQEITERLGEKITNLRRGAKPKFKRAAIFQRLRNSILDELDEQSPDFKQARSLWAGTKRADDMHGLGEDFLKPGSTPATIRETVEGLSDSDLQFYRLGIGRAIEERLATSNDNTNLGRVFQNEAFRQKIFAAFPSKESAVDFINTVRAETIKKTTTNAVGRGSQTAQRQAIERQLTGGEIGTRDVSKTGLIDRALSRLGRARESTIQEIGDLLLSQDRATQLRGISLLNQAQQPNPLLQLGPVSAASANVAGQSR